MTKNLTCIGCPMGCQLTAEIVDGAVLSVTGNTCKRGEDYARKECVAPMRTVTGTVRLTAGRILLRNTQKRKTPYGVEPGKMKVDTEKCLLSFFVVQ